MKKISLITLTISAIITCIISCKKPDKVPTRDLSAGNTLTIAQLKTIASCTNACSKRFNEEAYLSGVVIADEVSGNFYKEIYLRDYTGGIHLALTNSSPLLIGDSVRVNLKGLDVWINSTTSMLEIDSIDHEKNIIKLSSGLNPQPILINGIGSFNPSYYCDLVQINNVEFIPSDTNRTFSDAINLSSVNLTLQDCSPTQLVVRSSGYAKFAGTKAPKGKGSIIGIATNYQTTKQLVIRTPSELNMNGARGGCIQYHKKDFNDNSLTSGGWSQVNVNGAANWAASTFGGVTFAKISGYIGNVNTNTENWLISPALNISNAFNPVLTFNTAAKYLGNTLDVLVSTNYNSGNPSTATWTSLSPNFALSPNNPGNYAWTPSGILSLTNFKSSNTRIAFKYVSSSAIGATIYEVDDIIIREN